jgi:hypothetical protein
MEDSLTVSSTDTTREDPMTEIEKATGIVAIKPLGKQSGERGR